MASTKFGLFLGITFLCSAEQLFGLPTHDRMYKGQDTLVETFTVESKMFRNRRTLRVLLPPGYYDESQKEKRYPVLYLNDGFSVFKNWKLKETVYSLIDEGKIVPVIVVGIDNAINDKNTNPDFRTDEYLPYPDSSEPTVPHPHGSLYPDFLVKEVIPTINSRYRTKIGASNTALGGSSYGGFISIYTYLQRPKDIGNLILESTPFFLANEKIIEEAKKFKSWRGKIAIGIGTNETSDQAIMQRGKTAQDLLLRILHAHSSVDVKVTVTVGGQHNAKAWAERLPQDLQFLYAK
ncbi:MAG: alpha/beta hydrolase [Flavisolibacter sp.]